MVPDPVLFDAVVLAGGRGTRLGGADKAALELAGTTLLDRSLAALSSARLVVVVGDERPTTRAVLWTREEPAYGGPVAATYAGLDALRGGTPVPLSADTGSETARTHGSTAVVVVAVDMPGVTEATVQRVVAGMAGHVGAVLVEGGRRHLLFAADAAALARVRPQRAEGVAMRELWASLDLADVPAIQDEAQDVDRWADLTPKG